MSRLMKTRDLTSHTFSVTAGKWSCRLRFNSEHSCKDIINLFPSCVGIFIFMCYAVFQRGYIQDAAGLITSLHVGEAATDVG